MTLLIICCWTSQWKTVENQSATWQSYWREYSWPIFDSKRPIIRFSAPPCRSFSTYARLSSRGWSRIRSTTCWMPSAVMSLQLRFKYCSLELSCSDETSRSRRASSRPVLRNSNDVTSVLSLSAVVISSICVKQCRQHTTFPVCSSRWSGAAQPGPAAIQPLESSRNPCHYQSFCATAAVLSDSTFPRHCARCKLDCNY